MNASDDDDTIDSASIHLVDEEKLGFQLGFMGGKNAIRCHQNYYGDDGMTVVMHNNISNNPLPGHQHIFILLYVVGNAFI